MKNPFADIQSPLEKFPENSRQPRRGVTRYSTQMPIKLSGIEPQEPLCEPLQRPA